LQKKKRLRRGQLALRVQRHAHERAAEEAWRIPWQVLLAARNQYLDWQEFYYWARSIMESEHGIPDLLARKLDEACPGFLGAEKQYLLRHRKKPRLRRSGWANGLTNAFSGLRSKEGGSWRSRSMPCGKRDIKRPQLAGRTLYRNGSKPDPSNVRRSKEWRREAARCDETARLLPAIRKQRACFKLVDAERLAHAVSLFIDWEALAYWARPAFEAGGSLPSAVTHELDSRCPGFLESNTEQRGVNGRSPDDWHRLMLWISEHFFQGARSEG
jgi:hypothetical protein